MTQKVFKISVQTIIFIILSLLLFSCSADDRDTVPESRTQGADAFSRQGNSKAPGFTLRDLDGNIVDFKEYSGKVVLVDFWATWCSPCRRSIPHLNELHRAYSPQGFEVVGISLDRAGKKVVRRFAEEMNVAYTMLMGTRQAVIDWQAGPGIPVAFLVDRRGEVVKKFIGYQRLSVLENEILKYL